ncbi:hypothetical protein FM107_16895 [Sphingobacterium sp. JB170]|nr:hypothetical protein FM107_16895 [Sphingobacterium sp. JB170]
MALLRYALGVTFVTVLNILWKLTKFWNPQSKHISLIGTSVAVNFLQAKPIRN